MIRAKKSLGQHFLKSKAALADIIKAADLHEGDIVLEIGPGKGILTEALVQNAGAVIAIEKDAELIPPLQEKFAAEISAKKLMLVQGDILEFDPANIKKYSADLAGGARWNALGDTQGSALDDAQTTYKIVANIPYYITGAIIRTFLSHKYQPERMVLLLQKEVAKRIVAQNGKESILSLSVKAYGTPRYVDTVKARYFSPPPRVDSAILSIEHISKDFFQDISEELFFEFMKRGFAHKRKMLLGNLREFYAKEILEKAFAELGVPLTARAEDLPMTTWKSLAAKVV